MGEIAKTTVIVDGQQYAPGDVLPDLGSLIAVFVNGGQRHYEGTSADAEKLPLYVSDGSSCFMRDTGEYYKFDGEQRTWYKPDKAENRKISPIEVYGILHTMVENVSGAVESIKKPLQYMGSVDSFEGLPTAPEAGWVYNIKAKSIYGEAGMNVAWSGTEWDSLGPTIDMGAFVKVLDIVNGLNSDDTTKPLSAKQGKVLSTMINTVDEAKINYVDVVDDLLTSAANLPLSAAQGKVLKSLIDAIDWTTLANKPVKFPPESHRHNISEIDNAPDVPGLISAHNISELAHNDLRISLQELKDRVNAVLDSEDVDLDQLSEIVAYIKDNKSLIDGVTTSKVNVADIINNLVTNVANKPLSAAQGVALKGLIDAINWNSLTGKPTKFPPAPHSHTTPLATETVVGGIKAAAKTADETLEGKIDASTGKLYVKDTHTPVDVTLAIAGQAADAKQTGDRLGAVEDTVAAITAQSYALLIEGEIPVLKEI